MGDVELVSVACIYSFHAVSLFELFIAVYIDIHDIQVFYYILTSHLSFEFAKYG